MSDMIIDLLKPVALLEKIAEIKGVGIIFSQTMRTIRTTSCKHHSASQPALSKAAHGRMDILIDRNLG